MKSGRCARGTSSVLWEQSWMQKGHRELNIGEIQRATRADRTGGQNGENEQNGQNGQNGQNMSATLVSGEGRRGSTYTVLRIEKQARYIIFGSSFSTASTPHFVSRVSAALGTVRAPFFSTENRFSHQPLVKNARGFLRHCSALPAELGPVENAHSSP